MKSCIGQGKGACINRSVIQGEDVTEVIVCRQLGAADEAELTD